VPVHNSEIADIFNEMADLLEIEGANEFRVRAYRNAARTVSSLPQSIADMVKQGEDLSELPGIGKDLAGKITQIIKKGELPQLEDLRHDMPEELIELTHLAGLGPKRVKVLYQDLGIASLKQLREAAENKKISQMPGFGSRTEEKILEAIERRGAETGESKRLKLSVAEGMALPLVKYLQKSKGVKTVDVAGSYRRKLETVGDLDILAICEKDSSAIDRFVKYEDVAEVVSKGKTRSTVILRSGMQVDLRVIPQVSYGAALHYFTGSKAHTIAIRRIGVEKGLKINEYGVFKGKKRVAGRTEKEVYKKVGLVYIEPELRENRGEIEAAQKKRLPELVTLEDIKGDLHTHTNATEGHDSIEEMANSAVERGYQYIAVTDHSKHLAITKGLDEKRLARQIEEIDRLNKKTEKIVILKGIEVDILEDGSLDLSDAILKRLDLVVGSIHHKFNLSQDKQTDRILRAMSNPYFKILAHPSGRLINEREPYEIDMQQIIKAAKDKGIALELNAQPERLDLTDIYCKMAKDIGVMVAISTDAHSRGNLEFMRYGVYQARKGWLEARDVLNTKTARELKKILARN